MRIKLNNNAYKSILSTNWANTSADDAVLAWIINRALTSTGHSPMFDIDDIGCIDAMVVLTPVSDGYGGRDAIEISYPDVDLKWVDNHDLGDIHAVFRKKDSRLLGYLTTYYGNNGRGKLAAQDFDPAPGVRVHFD